ncbi:MAG: molybdopterin-dependent oxidoreductase [Gammaproteobacteria bacterium]|nr:molybdopterin-dependent oxidoreductase [Gammaproteobacteria bacterium]
MNRREFLKVSAALGAGTAVPAMLGGCATRPLPGSGEVTTTPTVCNMCFWQCAGTLYQEDGRPWKVVGHPDDPHCDGRLCTRGTGGIGAYDDPDRLRQPLLRVADGDGQRFEAVSWDEALDFIARRMTAIGEQHGKDRLALFSHGDGGKHFQRLLQAFGSHAYAHPSFAQCRGPRETAFGLTYGEGVGSPDRTDMANSRCIVLIGSHLGENLHNSQVQTFTRAIDNGATVITVDPRFSVAASKSQHWLAIKPGTDMALLLAWTNVLVNEGLYDRDYVARYCSGFDKLTAHVQPYNPEWAYLETGIEPAVIRATARVMAGNAPATLVHPGRHVTWYGDDTQRSRAIAILNALLGSWGRPGGFYRQEKVKLPAFPAPPLPKPSSDWKQTVQGDFPLVSTGISNRLVEHSIGDDAFIKGWFVYATNLPLTLPGATEQIKAAAESLELMVVVDTMPAEITGYADVVLPECTYLERYDDLRNKAERTPTLALRMPAFEPRQQSKPAWWMAKQLAEKLGLGRYFPWPDYTFVLDWQLKQVGSSLAEMQRLGVKRFARKTRPYFDDGEAIRFNTPSGRIELWSSLLAEVGQDPLPRYTPPERPPPGFYHLNYGRAPAHTFGRTINNPQLFELMPENTVWVHPSAAAVHGLVSSGYVRMENPNGRRSNGVRVRVTERIRPDSIFIVHGFGHSDERQRLARGVGADDAALMHNVKIDPVMGGTGMRASFVRLVDDDAAPQGGLT